MTSDTTPPQTDPPRSGIAPGTMINNNYEISRQISAGGMGEVYGGVNAFTGDPVAIKIVLESLSQDEKVATLFKREARILCQLSDKAIVRYYNFVRDEDLDRFCLIMEFIDGISLSDHVKANGPISVEEAKRLIRRLAQGLDEAHSREVTHRDLSPDNVMLRGGSIDEAVLIDFGIAKSAELTEGTLHGQLAGKFKYISPEQLGHYEGEISPRTDVYGFGLMIAAAVTGTPLDMGGSVVEAVNARRSIPDLGDVPAELRPLLARMLEPDPANRPPRMLDVIGLLDRPAAMADDQTIIRPAVPPQERASQPVTQPPEVTQEPVGSDSPFDTSPTGVANTLAAGNFMPAASPAPTRTPRTLTIPPPARVGRRRKGGKRSTVLLLLLLLGGGLILSTQLDLDPVLARVGLSDPPPPEPQALPNAGGRPLVDTPLTREAYLASYDAGDCTYATRINAGPNTGLIEVFASESGRYGDLPDAYETQFNSRPDLLERIIADAQCPLLDFARQIQTVSDRAPSLVLSSDKVADGESVSGILENVDGRSVWLFVVSGQGAVYNVSEHLVEEEDGTLGFSLGFGLTSAADTEAQLIVAVVSEDSLATASTAPNGSRAEALLPIILRSVLGEDEAAAGISIGYLAVERAPEAQPLPQEDARPSDPETVTSSPEEG
ncbi:serine/threonine-protein kinase [Aestuariibius insulae]|uniref:serine/threonine-protein kinase n=1 Tax=Aestuariibius insulae TaxID=2058287 RepID=UPI00345E78BD